MRYSNNRNVLYYSWLAAKTYGGINLMTVLFNTTGPRLGTPQQLENGAKHSIKQTANVIPNLFSIEYNKVFLGGGNISPHLLSKVLVQGLHILGNIIAVYLIYFITCMFLLLCVMYYVCELPSGVCFCRSYSYL